MDNGYGKGKIQTHVNVELMDINTDICKISLIDKGPFFGDLKEFVLRNPGYKIYGNDLNEAFDQKHFA